MFSPQAPPKQEQVVALTKLQLASHARQSAVVESQEVHPGTISSHLLHYPLDGCSSKLPLHVQTPPAKSLSPVHSMHSLAEGPEQV